MKLPSWTRYALVAIATLSCGLALAAALTQRPGCDEAWFGGPAYNLAFHGYMGTPALEPTTIFQEGRNLKGIDLHTYWIMPMSPILQAVWYRIFGFSLMAMRSISLVWAMVALAAWWVLMQQWKMTTRMMVIAIGLIALDYPFIRSAAHGRMDMMCAALNIVAFAAYFRLRERNLAFAIVISHTLAALSFLTHPNGLFGFIGLILFTTFFDLRRLRWWYVGLAAAPYLAALGAWSIYIAQAPDIFKIQFSGNSAGRFAGLSTPIGALVAEIRERYLGGGAGFAAVLRAIQTLPYLLAAGLATAIPQLRRNPALRAVLILAGFEFVYFWLLESTKLYLYVVHISPLFMVLLAAAIDHFWESGRVRTQWVASALALWALIQVGGVAYVVRRNDLGKEYKPVVQYLKDHASPRDVVMGSAELGFNYGFSDHFVDDVKLGAVSGKRPDYVVTEKRYTEWFQYAERKEPATYAHIRKLLNGELHLVYQQGSYQVYAR